jgi:hypothetical protein
MVHLSQACVRWNVEWCNWRRRTRRERDTTLFVGFFASTSFSSFAFLASSVLLLPTIRCHRCYGETHSHKFASPWFCIYTYTLRIISSFVSVITSRRIMFYNPTNILICVSLVFSLYDSFDLQGHESQRAWSTKKKNVKDKICLSIYSLYKQQINHVVSCVLVQILKRDIERKLVI